MWWWRGRFGGEEIRNAKFSWRQFPFSHLSEVLCVVLRACLRSSSERYDSQVARLQVCWAFLLSPSSHNHIFCYVINSAIQAWEYTECFKLPHNATLNHTTASNKQHINTGTCDNL
jgi:hypothetical protein